MSYDYKKIMSRGSQHVIDSTPVTDEMVRLATDTARLFFDLEDDVRIEITDFEKGYTEDQILGLPFGLPKIYLARDTKRLYIYDGTWKKISDSVSYAAKASQSDYARSAGTASYAERATNSSRTDYADTAGVAYNDADGNYIRTTYAPLNSPALTGDPSVPTASGTNDNSITNVEYVREAINTAISILKSGFIQFVDSYEDLPEEGEDAVIYLIPSDRTSTSNIYTEYIWKDGAYEEFGTADLNLEGYYHDLSVGGTGNAVTNVTYDAENDKLIFDKNSTFLTEHPSISTSAATTNASTLENAGNFSAITAVTKDNNGHVTSYRETSFTLPDYVNNAGSALYADRASTAAYSVNADTAALAINANTATYAINASSSAEATHASSADRAINADTSVYAGNAGSALYSSNAGTAAYVSSKVENAASAEYADYAVTAGTAANAGTSDYSTNAGSANYATNADTAVYANVAASASTASDAAHANTADNATNAGTADYATNAGSSIYSTNAGTATEANHASSATNAGTSAYATLAGAVENAGSSDYATNAGTAVYAVNSGSATYATNAGSAEYSDYAVSTDSADHAISADSATYDASGNNITSTYSPINSPTFTGIPLVPVASGNESSAIANVYYVSQIVQSAIDTLKSGFVQFVESYEDLPVEGEEGVLYLVPARSTEEHNLYVEYVWTGTEYEKFGTADLNIAGYYHDLSTTGSGNAVTNVTYNSEQDKLIFDKGLTFLTKHPAISTSSNTTAASTLSGGGSFDVITAVTRDSNGHITSYKKTTFSLFDAVTSATSATYATNAGTATRATKATNADTATYATNAGTATRATKATNADTATYATNAGTATRATNANTATYATNAGTATRSTNAGSATYATNAGSSGYATKAGGIQTGSTFDFGSY